MNPVIKQALEEAIARIRRKFWRKKHLEQAEFLVVEKIDHDVLQEMVDKW